MPIDFSGRVDDLAVFLASEYRIVDRQAIDILLAAQLPIDGLPFPRLILETSWPAFDTSAAWFTFAGYMPSQVLGELRTTRAPGIRMVDALRAWRVAYINQTGATLIVESNYERPVGAIAASLVRQYKQLLTGCVRLRTPHPKSAANLVLSPQRASAKAEKFKALVKDVLDCRFRRPVPIDPPAIPADFLYWCELAFKLAGENAPAWEALINHAGQAVVRHAYLYDRNVTPADWTIAGRLLADQVPWWTRRLIECIEDSELKQANSVRAGRYTGMEYKEVWRAHKRARREQALRYEKRRPHTETVWSVNDDNIFRLAKGHAFGVVS